MWWSANSIAAADSPKVVFLPFNVLSAGKYAYLQDAAGNMLAGRLAAKTTIRTANRSKGLDALGVSWKSGEEGTFDRSLKSVQADYIIAGIIVEQEGLPRFDVYVYHIPTGKSRKFTKKPQGVDAVIGAVDELAWELAENVFGAQRPSSQIGSKEPKESSSTRFQTPHPDRLFKNAIVSGLYGIDNALSGSDFKALPSWSSKRLNLELKSMAVGDVDGDGQDEMILASNTKLILYKHKENGFQEEATLKLLNDLKVYFLYLADLNKNGLEEIYLNCSRGDRPSTYVIEWSKTGKLEFLNKDIDSYLRPIVISGKGMVLIGQEAALDGPIGSSVYLLKSSGPDIFAQEQKLSLPSGANIFNFAYADVDNDGLSETVVIDQENKINLYSKAGELLWRSKEEYGASGSYLGRSLIEQEDSADRQLFYIPSRIVIADVNNDGKDDLIVGKNKMSKVRFFKNLRFFESGTISALMWNGSSMVELWQTSSSPSYISDYQLRTKGFSDNDSAVSTRKINSDEGQETLHSVWLYIGRQMEEGLLSFFGASSKVTVYEVTH